MTGSNIDPRVFRSRTIRERVLQLLDAARSGNPDVFVPHSQIVTGFSTGRVRFTVQEIEGELMDLLDVQFLDQESAGTYSADPLEKFYRITRLGHEFKRAGYPWDKIDTFTGHQSL